MSTAPQITLNISELAAEDRHEPLNYTDLGNARRLIAAHGRDLRFDTGRQGWRVWRNGRWEYDTTGEVHRRMRQTIADFWANIPHISNPEAREAAAKWALKSEAGGRLTAAVDIAKSEPGIAVDPVQLDSDPWALNCRNGTIDLRTGQLRPHRREDLLTRQAQVAYDHDADCPLWLSVLERIQPEVAMRDYLQRLAGYFLSGDVSVQEFWIWWGEGANGKNLTLDTLMGLMGDYAGLAADSLLTSRMHDEHPTELMDLMGRRLVVGSETEEGAKLRIQLVKRLTGNATIKGRHMRCDYVEFPRTHKLVLMTNNRPTIPEGTNAVWRRLRLVPFGVVIPEAERDGDLPKKLMDEWPGILAWAVRGCLAFQKDGIGPPPEVRQATAEYAAQQDVLADFLEARCIIGEGMTVSRANLWSDYTQWARLSGENRPLDKVSLFDRIRRKPGIGETMRRVNGQPAHVFTGIALCCSTADVTA